MRSGNFSYCSAALISILLSFSFLSQLNAAVIDEYGSLQGFFSGTAQGCDYDNWVSHTSEADQVNNPNNFSPPELDLESNSFGHFQVIDDLPDPNGILADWSAIFRYLIQGDAAAADSRLAGSWMAGKYEVVHLTDNGQEYLILREVLNNDTDDNGTPDDNRDDVTGSFDLGWGLFVVRLNAGNPQVVIEVVHPSTDFIAPHIAFDAFNTMDAGCLFVNGASRNAAWSGPTYSESVSLSDPSRNERTAFQEAHKAAVDLLQNEWVIQVHGYNPYPAHDGVPSAQISAEREDKTNPNVPIMSWDHFDLISLVSNPPVTTGQNWPYSEPQIDDYFAVYYPGHYNWQGEIPIANNIDLPGTLSNCQMVYSHIGHDFVNDPENWTHIEFDEYPDIVRLDNVSMLDFYRYNELGPRVPTWENFIHLVHYYHPIFAAAAEYLAGPNPIQASVVYENGSLMEFYQGSTQALEYDNWVSHFVEGIASPGYNDYGPVELDRQTNGFGNFQRVPNGLPGDDLLNGWRDVFNAFVSGNANATATALTTSGLGGIYQVVQLTDGDEEYMILREKLDDFFFDDNGTLGNAADDVTGSFGYGWGLYIKNLNAPRPEVVFEAPHPCDDYISPANGMDAFLTTGAGMLFVAGAGREVAWTDVAPYYNSKSISDPTRNARHPFHIAHMAAVDAIEGELIVQLHSYDSEAHLTSKSIELSAYDDPTPNYPLMDRTNYVDIISQTSEYPIAANTIGGGNHAAVRVNEYYSVHYPSGTYSWNGTLPMTTSVSQWGYSSSPQMLYSHANHNNESDPENWLHFEQDEFPNVISENVLSFYNADGAVPTYQNFTNSVAYYHPFYDAIARTLNPVPVWTSVPAPINTAEGNIVQFTLTGSDANGDALTVALAGNLPPAVQFTDNGNGSASLYWQTDYTSAGNYTATFQLSDGFSSITANVPITVNNVNRPPVLAGIGSQSVDEGAALSFALSATDPDGDTLTYSATGLPQGATLTGDAFSWTPNFVQAGSYNVTFEVSDGSASDNEMVSITVNNVNASPVLSSIGAKSVDEGTALTFTLSATDSDGDVLTYLSAVLPQGATLTDADFSWTPDFDQAGSYNVTFEVSDGSTTDYETITITVNNSNRDPVLAAIGAKSVDEGSALSFTLSASDPDGDSLTYSAANLPTGSSLIGADFNWTPDYTQAGSYDVTFEVSDGSTTDAETVTITVNNINRDPVLAGIGAQSVNEGVVLNFTLSATDLDADALTYSATGLPQGATLTDGAFSWTPDFAQAGTFNVIFQVSDGLAIDAETVTITVNNVNASPVLSSIGAKSVDEGAALAFTLSATDYDDDTLTYSATDLPAGASLAGVNFSWTPDFVQAGSYEVIFDVSDGSASDAETVTITVNNTNRVPVLAVIGDRSVDEGVALTFTLSADDPDGDALTYTATGLPQGATLTDDAFSWTPDYTQAGTFNVTFEVSDGFDVDGETVSITVNNINLPPVFVEIADTLVDEGALLVFTLSATDPDNDALTYSVANLPIGAVLEGADFIWTPAFDQAGSYGVTFEVSDGAESDYKSMTITVINTNRAPIWTNVPEPISALAGDQVTFTITGSDPDNDSLTITYQSGLPEAALFVDNGGGNGDLTWQTDQQSGGEYTALLRLSDGSISVDVTVDITISGGIVNAYASSEQTVSGTVQRDYTTTVDSDDSYEILTEIESGGRPNRRYSLLEHVWTFQLTGYNLELHAEAYHNANDESDDFILAGSFDGQNYTDLLTVTKTSDDNVEQTAEIAGTADGMYYVRVVDTDHSEARKSLDSLYMDNLFISYTAGEAPNQAPVWVSVPDTVDAYVGNLIEFTVAGIDPEGDTLSVLLSSTDIPEGYNFADNGDGSGVLDWQTAEGNEGSYSATFILSDGELADTVTVVIKVSTPPEMETMLVDDITLTLSGNTKNLSCRGTITIFSDVQAAVPGALVSATWSGLINGNVQGTTNDAGQVTFSTGNLRNPTGNYILTVTDVSKDNWFYDANSNVETTDQITVSNGRLAGKGGIGFGVNFDIPNEVTLGTPFPNPFNNQTSIRVGMPEKGYASLVVYDLYGRRVLTLVSSNLTAGWHSINWTPQYLPNGEYLIRLDSNSETRIVRVLLIK